MSSDLFREEALDYQSASNSRFGKPTGIMPPAWSRITFLLACFIGALLIFLFTVDFARKEKVRGKLRVDGAEAKVYALEAGRIYNVMVSDGQSVSAGDPVAQITTERLMSDGEALSETLLAELAEERTTLQERRAAVDEAAILNIEAASQRLRDAERREREMLAQLGVANNRVDIARQRAADAEQFLAEALIVEAQLNERLDALASLTQNALQIEAQLAEAIAAQSRAQFERQQARAARKRDLADIDQRLGQISAQMKRTNAETAHIVTAPIDGVIASLSARAGEQAIAGVPLAVILPEQSELIAEVYLPSRAIGFIEPGQTVKLQYDAFPYQKFGVARGEIATVASTAQLPQEIGVPSQTGEPLYRVSIQIEAQSIEAFSRNVPLQAGMELSADIVLENRRLLEWLLEPLRS
ncbi:MAG: HlyD family efflux transporter periplasmic adaptor subunit [Pseudomonadota bacterium]